MADLRKNFGEKLRNLRKDHRLSQQALGDKLGLEGATISRWETAFNLPKPKEIERLAEVFGVPVSVLFESSPDLNPSSSGYVSKAELKNIIDDRLGTPRKPTPEEALAVIAEALTERRTLLESVAEFSKNQPQNENSPKLTALLSAIEEHPSILDLALGIAKGFGAATKHDQNGSPRSTG